VRRVMRPLQTLSRITLLGFAAVCACGGGSSTSSVGDASVGDGGREEGGGANDATTGTGAEGGGAVTSSDGSLEAMADATPGSDAGADAGGPGLDAGTDSYADAEPSNAEASADAGPDSAGVLADATVDGGPVRAVAVAAGTEHTCALLSDGTVECWGESYYGQLGNGSATGPQTCGSAGACSTTPVAVSGLTGVRAIAAGDSHNCALLSDRTVQCWGDNTFGQLGDGMSTGPQSCSAGGTFGCSSTPVTVSGLSGALAITAGYGHTCALLSGGTLECWGDNAYGELGNGSCTGPEQCDNPNGGFACSTTPIAVPGLSSVTAMAAGTNGTYMCVLLSGGSVECWGAGDLGELGNGMTTGPATCTWGTFSYTAFTSPVSVSGITSATSVAAGGDDSCALVADGGVECWGMNYYGQLGDGTATGPDECDTVYPCSTTPVAVSGLTAPTSVVTGGATTCALLSGGTVECWGADGQGALGIGDVDAGSLDCDNDSDCSTIPLPVSGLSGVTSLAAGGNHTCAVKADGTVWCWGYNNSGQLGNGTYEDSATPVKVGL
jgi:alpha-tubulin suppressor-like RCC1 family protein